MKITLGFSSCPNDTFIFDALVNHRIDTQDLVFEEVVTDVEELNQKALRGELDVTKISYHAWLHVWRDYQILDSGSALGRGNGPLLVARNQPAADKIPGLNIAVPGQYTTANLLLSLAYPSAKNKKIFLFSEIEEAILRGRVDAGVLIHESRFTYERAGLKLVDDLGRYWEELTGQPIPLGGIMVHRRLPLKVRKTINSLLRSSIDHARECPSDTIPYMKRFAQTMEEKIMDAHLKMFVNDFTLCLGAAGREAIEQLGRIAVEAGIISTQPVNAFIDP